jgi:hypothetical protein
MRTEIRGGAGQNEQLGAGGAYGLPCGLANVRAEIGDDDDVARISLAANRNRRT